MPHTTLAPCSLTNIRRLPALLRAMALVCATGTGALAQSSDGQPPASTTAIDARVRREVVDTLAARFERLYVDADTGRLIARRLREQLARGTYDTLTNPRLFAEALTRDLRSVNGDLHLSVAFTPGQPGFRVGPAGLPTPGRPPRDADAPPPRPGPAAIAQARAINYQVEQVARLEGNVGYVEFRGFSGVPGAFDVASTALKFLENADAIIFDLRRHGGGSGALSNFIISHFTGPDTVPVLTIRNRSANEEVTRYTLREVPGMRRPDVPLYVLVSRGTVSAGEDFAFVLQNLGRATIVGERTAGAGHNNALIDIGNGFSASISFTRVMDPRSGKEWERVGVRPDLAVRPESALVAAHLRALGALIERASDPARKRVLTLTREVVEAQAHPRRIAAATLASYAGTYGGERTITVEGGRLTFRRYPHYPPMAMVPISDSTFAVETLRLTFERAANGRLRLRETTPSGASLTFERSGPAAPARH